MKEKNKKFDYEVYCKLCNKKMHHNISLPKHIFEYHTIIIDSCFEIRPKKKDEEIKK